MSYKYKFSNGIEMQRYNMLELRVLYERLEMPTLSRVCSWNHAERLKSLFASDPA
jgi:hypothetical protein